MDGIKKDIRERRLDEAAKKLDAARKSIDDDNFFSIRGDIDFLSGDFASAEKNYLSITAEKRPWCAALNLGLIAIQTGRPKEAAAYLASVKPTRKNIGDSPVYGEKYRDIKSLNVDVALYLGVINKSEGRMREAAEFFEKAGRLGAPAGIINANLGDIYFKQDNYDKAISFYEAAIRESDDHLQKSSLYNDLGLAYFRKGLSQEAIESLKQALILNPENKNAVYNLGVIYVKSGFQEKIKDDYKEFLKRDDGVEIVYNLTRSMMDAAKKEADKVESIDFIGEDASIKKVKAMLVKAAETDSTVFIQGENGTGKELAARAIHKLSRRNEGPFVVVNCAALPETLLESELFGYEKGAFTGAVKDRTGRFESADGGTVFLDEIGDITPAMQVKLLRFVQNREFERIGGNKTRKADVRIITATNRDIKKLVSEGLFREDLFYRLYVLPVIMPPLRERGSDIIQLARHFLNYFAMKYKKPFKDFEKDALSAMMGCSWP
ncbi:MAG TPA: sigma 54-interacting transcriptional regulator, partial [Candidatus Goldiibacteriota bacterium]|nr:sigma 54-interacting transcriptional regulator [Candidatus Goldiibacteriota bacterium]